MPVEPDLYNDKDLARMRAGQENPWVMYFIVRKELGMSAEKIAVQCAHAAQMILLRYHDLQEAYRTNFKDIYAPINDEEKKVYNVKRWIAESFRKVILAAKDKEFEKIKEQFDCFVVKDAGLTEVATGTETVLVLWPMRKNEQPKILKRLRTRVLK